MVRLAYSSTADDDPNVLKDLKKLNMWEPLHSLLSSEMSPLLVKVQALWVIGTALQNNPSAQDAVRLHFDFNACFSLIDHIVSRTRPPPYPPFFLSTIALFNSPISLQSDLHIVRPAEAQRSCCKGVRTPRCGRVDKA
jgi:hypothetical protein